MTALIKNQIDIREKEFWKKLDKGLDDLVKGRTIPHEETMKILRERIRIH